MNTSTILQTILEHKRVEIERDSRRKSLAELEETARSRNDRRGFLDAMRRRIQDRQAAVIAEIKKASPSRGLIREDFDPVSIALQYQDAGATCLSILTDERFFQGHRRHLEQARAACSLPVIRKDFTVDPYQVAEAGAMGADCILLIVAALSRRQLQELSHYAAELALDVLVEVHDEAELETALEGGVSLVGINNRNLHDFQTDIRTTLRLAERVPPETLIVTESGIHRREDVQYMQARGIHGFLIGESLMRAPSPGERLSELIRVD